MSTDTENRCLIANLPSFQQASAEAKGAWVEKRQKGADGTWASGKSKKFACLHFDTSALLQTFNDFGALAAKDRLASLIAQDFGSVGVGTVICSYLWGDEQAKQVVKVSRMVDSFIL